MMHENFLGRFTFTLAPPDRPGKYFVMHRDDFELLQMGEKGQVRIIEVMLYVDDDLSLVMSGYDDLMPTDDLNSYAWALLDEEVSN